MARVLLLTPPRGPAVGGNRTSAARWSGMWRELGHAVDAATELPEHTEAYDACVALHAVKSAAAALAFRVAHPTAPLVAVLSGTELSPAGELDAAAIPVLDCCDAIVTLNGASARRLEGRFPARLRTILQSAEPFARTVPTEDRFELLFSANLRSVKDPLRIPAALDLLDSTSRVHVVHVGAALDERLGHEFAQAAERQPRLHTAGAVDHTAALAHLARSRGLINTSLVEGASSSIAEALVSGVPVIASDAESNVDLLGPDWPLLFPRGDARALSRCMRQLELDRELDAELDRRLVALAAKLSPAVELDAWRRLLRELSVLPN